MSERRVTMTEKHRFNIQRWKLLINERVKSGLSVREFCEVHGIGRTAYYYWLEIIRKENLPAAMEQLTLQASETTLVEISRPVSRVTSVN